MASASGIIKLVALLALLGLQAGAVPHVGPVRELLQVSTRAPVTAASTRAPTTRLPTTASPTRAPTQPPTTRTPTQPPTPTPTSSPTPSPTTSTTSFPSVAPSVFSDGWDPLLMPYPVQSVFDGLTPAQVCRRATPSMSDASDRLVPAPAMR